MSASSWTYDSAVAALMARRLPADFDRWDLADQKGCTVAHVAAAHGHLPADFDRWDLLDPANESPFGELPADIQDRARAWHAAQADTPKPTSHAKELSP